MKATRFSALIAIATAVLTPTLLHAQLAGKFVFTPYAGVFVPSGDLGRLTVNEAGTEASVSARHQTALALGSTASFWITDRVALEGGLVYSGSDLKSKGLLNETGSITQSSFKDHANVWLVSTKVLVQLLPSESDYNLRLGFGPALITRNGSAYKNIEGKYTGLTDMGAALSLCSRLRLTDNLGLRLRAEDYVYQAKIGFKSDVNPSNNITLDERRQSDFVFSLGFQMFLNR
jgi:outer membrane protein W